MSGRTGDRAGDGFLADGFLAQGRQERTIRGMANFYDELGVPSTASQNEIDAAYEDMLELGEDMPGTVEHAYRTLSDPHRRALYDAGLHAARPEIAPPADPRQSDADSGARNGALDDLVAAVRQTNEALRQGARERAEQNRHRFRDGPVHWFLVRLPGWAIAVALLTILDVALAVHFAGGHSIVHQAPRPKSHSIWTSQGQTFLSGAAGSAISTAKNTAAGVANRVVPWIIAGALWVVVVLPAGFPVSRLFARISRRVSRVERTLWVLGMGVAFALPAWLGPPALVCLAGLGALYLLTRTGSMLHGTVIGLAERLLVEHSPGRRPDAWLVGSGVLALVLLAAVVFLPAQGLAGLAVLGAAPLLATAFSQHTRARVVVAVGTVSCAAGAVAVVALFGFHLLDGILALTLVVAELRIWVAGLYRALR